MRYDQSPWDDIPDPLLALQRRLFPLRGPRLQAQAFMPWHVVAVAVDAYFEAFFSVMAPPASRLSDDPAHPVAASRADLECEE